MKQIKIHTIILAGSVLKPGFPWRDLLGVSVERVINDCGIHDKDSLIEPTHSTVYRNGGSGGVQWYDRRYL